MIVVANLNPSNTWHYRPDGKKHAYEAMYGMQSTETTIGDSHRKKIVKTVNKHLQDATKLIRTLTALKAKFLLMEPGIKQDPEVWSAVGLNYADSMVVEWLLSACSYFITKSASWAKDSPVPMDVHHKVLLHYIFQNRRNWDAYLTSKGIANPEFSDWKEKGEK